jgi:ABC-type phosphate/phosphonate transport system substrate-binding protein
MKKIGVILVLVVAITALLACPMRATEKKVYTFGMRLGFGMEFDAQNKTIFTDVVNAFSKTQGIAIDFMWFNTDNDLQNALKKGDLDFVYLNKYVIFMKLLKNPDYIPFVMPYFIDRKSFNQCIYVNKESKFKNIDDLKHSKLTMATDAYSYYILRDSLKEKPETFFESVTNSPNVMSMVYSLAMNTTDAIFTGDTTLFFMKMNNPGPTKKLLLLKCYNETYFPPIMASNKVPADVKNKLLVFLADINKEESLKKYRPLMQTYKLKFFPVNRENYDSILRLSEKAEKNGWDKDYEYWMKTVHVEGK